MLIYTIVWDKVWTDIDEISLSATDTTIMTRTDALQNLRKIVKQLFSALEDNGSPFLSAW